MAWHAESKSMDDADGPITIVTMIWHGARGYTLAHAEAIAAAVARHATFPYRFVAITDDAPRPTTTIDVIALPCAARRLMACHYATSQDAPACLPKLWLFSREAQQLGPRILYLDADSLVIDDLAPIIIYRSDAPFVGMTLRGKLSGGMYCLQTGMLHDVWTTFLRRGHDAFVTGECAPSDQGWMRCMELQGTYPVWPNREMGIYLLKELDGRGPISPLPADARIVHPTGKTKPWHPKFLDRYPWAKEHYPWTRSA